MLFDWRKHRVLLVDGDDQFRFWVRGLLLQQRAAGVLSLGTVQGSEEEVCRQGPSLALLELNGDGAALFAFLHWLRGHAETTLAQLPVILMIKDVDKAVLEQASVYGIQGVLKKPLSGDLLMKALVSVARNPRAVTYQPPRPAAAAAFSLPLASAPPKPLHSPASAPAAPARAAARPGAPMAGGGGALRLPAGKSPAGPAGAKGTYGEEPPPPAAAPQGIEGLEPPPAVKAKATFADDLAPPPAAPPLAFEPASPPPDKAVKKRKAPAEPRPNDGKAVAGRDLDAILEEHARWVCSGGTEGRRAVLEGEDLSGRTLAEAPLTNASLRRCDLSGSDLGGAELHGADLRHAEILGGVLSGANLAVARLRHARLRGCRLEGANLTGADLAGADLSGALCAEADFKGANLLGAVLDDTDLSAAKGLTQAQLETVRGTLKTRLPPGLFLPGGD
ncbi:secreted effector protein pipB2 [mine drainage metagenome]|uniref:Secreted effector protein pipB2 n=1 Tax=mine drainage metagenome TaxID=410659 RepID=A0A1J5RRQ5_9ZZZZ